MATYDYDLGAYHRAVTTNSPEAQLWFDRGLVWCYGYNHEEAVRCFRAGGKRRPRLRHGLLGHRLCRRPQLQQAVEGLRSGRSEAIARHGVDCDAEGAGPAHEGEPRSSRP